MNKNKIYNSFVLVLKSTQKGWSGKSHIKYKNPKIMFGRFYKLLNSLRDDKKTRGLDFGCAHGACCILGKIMGMSIVGMDRPVAENDTYGIIQDKLCERGYDIVNISTLDIPWGEFQDSEFDFIIGVYSLNKAVKLKKIGKASVIKVISEMERITSMNGVWIIEPKKTSLWIGDILHRRGNKKNIEVIRKKCVRKT